jgi:adenylyltransferase/sulfurtransferase
MGDAPLFLDDNDRYAGLQLIAWWKQEVLRRAHVLVVGAGALGNEVLKNLALVGVGRLTIVDCDRIETSNLTRAVLFRAADRGRPKAEVAAAALADLNPDVQVRPILGNVLVDVGLGLFRDCDVVIGCLDNREARLWVNRCCWKTGRPWIDGAIQEINGVVKVFVPPDSACYECGMTENDYRLINLRYSCPLLRHEDLQAGKVPTAPTIASMIGGLQTQEALKLLHRLPVQAGAAIVLNGLTNRSYTTRFQRRDDCLSHETWPAPLALPLAAARDSARRLFELLQAHVGAIPDATLVLDRDLVVSLDCATCGAARQVLQPLPRVPAAAAACPRCGQVSRPVIVHTVEAVAALAAHSLAALGIPAYDVVRVVGTGHEHFVLLADDAPQWS